MVQPHKSMFARMYFSFAVVLLVIVLVLSILLYFNFEKVAVKFLTDSNVKALSQISYSASYMNDNARSLALSVFSEANTTQLMYQKGTDFNELQSQMERIREFVRTNFFVSSLYVYNRQADQFFSTEERIVNNKASFTDQGIVEAMQRIVRQSEKLKPIPRKIPVYDGGIEQQVQYTNVYSYIVYDLFTPAEGIDGAVIVNVKGEYLRNIIGSLSSDSLTDGDMLIVDRDGIAVSDAKEKVFLQNLSGRPYVNKVLLDQNKSGYFIDRVDGKRAMVTFASSDVLGWKFISITPYDVITKQFNKIKQTSILVCLLFLIFGVGVSFFISRSLSSPLQVLVNRISKMRSPSQTDNRKMDEVSLLTEVFDDTYQKAMHFGRTTRTIRMIRKDGVLIGLLQNQSCDIGKLQAVFEKYDIRLIPSKNYILIGFRIDRFTAFVDKYSLQDRILLRYAIGNAAKEIFGQIGINEAIDVQDDMIVLILHTDRPEEQRLIFDTCEDLLQWTACHLNLSLSASMGYIGKNLLELKQSYREMFHISRYRLVYGYGSILSPYSLKDLKSTPFKFSKNFDKNLHGSLIKGDIEDMRNQYESVLLEVINYSYDTIMSTVLYLTYSIYNILNVIEENSLSHFNVNFNSFTKDISNEETIESISEQFQKLFSHIDEVIQIQKNNRNRVVTDTIVNMIETNYRDKGMCLTSIANTINMSKVYVGKLFRESLGQSVAEYITDLRMKKVLKYLEDGRQHLSDILDEVGIENKNYFYKQFKSKMGVSFSDYRLKNINKAAQAKEIENSDKKASS